MKKLKLIPLALILMVCGITLAACSNKSKAQTVTISFITGVQENIVAKPDSITRTVGKKYGELPIPTREGFSFSNWWTGEATGTRVVATTLVTKTEAHSLYARWIDNRTEPEYTLPTGLYATYGQTLSQVSLPTGWTWAVPGATPVGNAGQQTHQATYTSTDLKFRPVTVGVTVTVAKAPAPGALVFPTTYAVVYYPTLTLLNIALIGGTTNDGTFTWTNPMTSISVADNGFGFSVTFIPSATSNYNYPAMQLTQDVYITVLRAIPPVASPIELTATFGDTLADVTLPSEWRWIAEVSTPVGDAGNRLHNARFTPSDTVNYSTVDRMLTISVEKAVPSYNVPTGLIGVAGDILTNVELPAGWAWVNTWAIISDTAQQTHQAMFTPTDTANYNSVVTDVTIDIINSPSAPQNIVTSSGINQITMNWSAPANNGGSAITGYQVSIDNWVTFVNKTATQFSHTFTGLTDYKAYAVQVRAMNIGGPGAAEYKIATLFPIVENISYNQGILRFKHISSASDYIITVSGTAVARGTDFTLVVSELLPENFEGTGNNIFVTVDIRNHNGIVLRTGTIGITVRANVIGSQGPVIGTESEVVNATHTVNLSSVSGVAFDLATMKVSFNAVTNATKYGIKITGTSVETEMTWFFIKTIEQFGGNLEFVLSTPRDTQFATFFGDFVRTGTLVITIVAINDIGDFGSETVRSEAITVQQLSAPTLAIANGMITWNSVANASTYHRFVIMPGGTSPDSGMEVSSGHNVGLWLNTYSISGVHSINVQALSGVVIGGIYYRNSEFSNTVSYIVP